MLVFCRSGVQRPRGGRTRENAPARTGLCSIHVLVDGSRRTAATFRFTRFLFSSPSSFLPAGRALLPSHEESRCAHVPATAEEQRPTPPLLRASPFLSFAVCLSSCSSAALLLPASSCSFAACLLWVFSLTAASAPLFFRPGRPQPGGRLIDGGFLGEEPSVPFHLSLRLFLSPDPSRRHLHCTLYSSDFNSTLSTKREFDRQHRWEMYDDTIVPRNVIGF